MAGKIHRKLAAIMFTDIVGYSAIMQDNETQGRLIRNRHKSVFEQCVTSNEGKIIQYYGDGALSVFPSAVSAVECAVSIQKELKIAPKVPLRIGIHLGDIHYDDTDVYGHGVNIAARIEPVCNAGGIFISGKVYDEIRNHSTLKATSLGLYQFKNVDNDLELFAVTHPDVAFPSEAEIEIIHDIAKKVNLSSIAGRSEAIRRYSKRIQRKKRKRMGQWAMITLFALIGITAIWRMSDLMIPKIDEGKVAIAVLPFSNIGGEEDNEYFSDGMTEDILTLLSKIEGISVTSRTSAMQYKDSEKSLRDIAKELRVNTILEGSVRREGDRVRINAQLINAIDDSHLWAQMYDAEVTDIFDVQSQVAEDITKQLKSRLTLADRAELEYKPAENFVAYEYYLRGRKKYREYTPEDNEEAIRMFNKALETDPNYAYAFAGLGDAYAQKAFHAGMDGAILDTAVFMSQRAIEIDPELSEGFKSLGLAKHYKGEMEDAMKQYEHALDLDPNNDMAANNLGVIARSQGDLVEAAKWAARTRKINVSVPKSVVNLADIYLQLGDIENAEILVDEGLELNNNEVDLNIMKGAVLIRKGDIEAAKSKAKKIIALKPEYSVGYEILGEAYMQEKDWAAAQIQFDEALKHQMKKDELNQIVLQAKRDFCADKSGDKPFDFDMWAETKKKHAHPKGDKEKQGKYEMVYALIDAGINSEMGNKEAAIEALENACKSGWLDYKSSEKSPLFANLQGEPEYEVLMNKIKMHTDSVLKKVNLVVKPGS
jgi:TolB-like protein/class 3 adenylate cyclase/Flp pilus assembly protein TadD